MNRKLTVLMSITASCLISSVAWADSLNNTKWQTVDDKTGEKKAIIQLTESNGQVSGKIIKVHNPEHAKAKCSKCKGSLKNQPIEGLQILTGLKADGDNKWTDGKLVDPETGKIYSGKVTLADDGKSLELRGYVGAPIFGRSQTWIRVQ